MNHPDVLLLIGELGPTIKEMIAEALAPLTAVNASLTARLEAIETRPHPRSVTGSVRDETGVVLLTMSDGSLLDSKIRDGKDGAPGRDGVDGRPGEQGRNGVNGKDGRDGIDGKDGAPGTQGEAGQKGDRGEPGQPGDRGEPGPQGPPGKAATGIKSALINRAGELVLTLDDGSAHTIGLIVGRDGDKGADGRDGADGLSFADFAFDVAYDSERTMTLSWSNAGKVETRAFHLPVAIHRGIYEAGRKYQACDEVIFGGTTFRARIDTEKKPETEDRTATGDWFMVAKRGRDGNNARALPPPAPGPVRIGA